MNGSVWCVQHRDGWCATADGAAPADDATSVKTACGYFVTLPFGSKRRKPDCQDCLRDLVDRDRVP